MTDADASNSSKLAYSFSIIQDILQCPLCLDCFQDPRVLPCQHVVCCSCIPLIISTNKVCSIVTCPLCRLIFPYTNAKQFPVSYTHNQLRDLVPTNYDIKGRCSKCKEVHQLSFCPCCDYHICDKCFKNDRQNALIHLETILQTYRNELDRFQENYLVEIRSLMKRGDTILQNPQTAPYNDILWLFYRMKYIYDQMNTLPVTYVKRTHEDIDQDSESPNKQMRSEPRALTVVDDDEEEEEEDEIVYLDTIEAPKQEEYNSQNQKLKEKRPFLRKRQGLAHYQAPPKRRQSCPKLTDNNANASVSTTAKNETTKRPTSANNTSGNSRSTGATTTNLSNPRARSQSSSTTSGRQTPTNARPSSKTKPIKQTNSSTSVKPTAPTPTPSNLLGKVDLDDEDDLLIKYQSKKPPMEINKTDNNDKFHSTIQTMIDTKWNTYKSSFRPTEDEPNVNNVDDDEDDDDIDLYSTARQRTSSRSSGTQSKVSYVQPKKDLDDFEKIEQYAEEHPSMISTASYVEKVVFKDHQQTKTADLFVNRLTRYHDEVEEDESHLHHAETTDVLVNPNRIRQRKVIPFKNKVNARIEQLAATAAITSDKDENEDDDDDRDHDDDDDDDDDNEDRKWDNIGVAKIIPVTGDEYNSDSGISSFKTDFPKQQQQHLYQQQKKDSARSSDFGDDQSWADRVSAPPPPQLNSLMLNTFPGLRHNMPKATPVSAPPPPPASQSVTEHNQDYSRLVREKAKELEKQIELFEKENAKLQSLCNERNTAIKKLKQDRDDFEKSKQKDIDEFNRMKEEEMKKLRQEKRLFEQHRQQLRDHPDKREREEIETLKKQVLTLQEDLKQRETRWSTTINRLKERIETLEYENAELKQEKDIIERKRLDLMHQLQTMPKQQQQFQDDTSSLSTGRKSIAELSQSKQRPKSTVPVTSKVQSLPKTMVVRNSEPSTKPKVTSNGSGRRTPTTTTVGVNGIRNNVDTSRKLSSLPATKRPTSSMNEFGGAIESIPIPTVIEQPLVISERADSGNGESDEDITRLERANDDRMSPSLSSLLNSDYPKSFVDDDGNDDLNPPTALDYKSLLTMATRTSSSATTLLKRHQETLSLLDQPTVKRQPLSMTNNDSLNPTPRVNIPTTAKGIAFKENLLSLSSDGVIEEIRHNDGRIERIKSDQSKQILFPNGSKQDISADGKHIRVQFYNGDYKEKFSDGRCVYRYVTTNTTETEYPDGTRVCEFANGQIEKHLPDGRQEHVLPDKTKNIYLTDGTIISIKPNGEKFIQHPNQTKEVHTDTYKRKLFPNGSILTVFNTGEQEVRYANGKIKIKDAHGNIIAEKKTPK
ncbi:unnamed protein product [Adineta ricciae]|uniref:RING-type domain-containing protein n=1 Tax=Adineta ricciae TaxID=249248 RepID=A0A814EH76_ADIRI|nr:unnamed protein product [Adineta ricciae]